MFIVLQVFAFMDPLLRPCVLLVLRDDTDPDYTVQQKKAAALMSIFLLKPFLLHSILALMGWLCLVRSRVTQPRLAQATPSVATIPHMSSGLIPVG